MYFKNKKEDDKKVKGAMRGIIISARRGWCKITLCSPVFCTTVA